MPRAHADALLVTRRVLRLLMGVNLLAGFLIAALLVASLAAERFVMEAVGVRSAGGRPTLILGMRMIMVLGIGAVPLAHVVLSRLLWIVETVSAGDPFVSRNAARLKTIAWAVLGLELLHLAVGAVAAGVATEVEPLDIDWSFSVTRWLAVLLLFVLARVFEQGARMREELEGTV